MVELLLVGKGIAIGARGRSLKEFSSVVSGEALVSLMITTFLVDLLLWLLEISLEQQ
jgi:hypothetical protein